MGEPGPHSRRRAPLWFSHALFLACTLFPAGMGAQSAPAAGAQVAEALPDAPTLQSQKPSDSATGPYAPARGAISGTVLDSAGDILTGVSLTLQNLVSHNKRSTISDANGYFRFAAVEPGAFSLTASAPDFAPWTETDITLEPGADLDLPHIALQLASTTTDVTVVFSPYDLATEQLQIEEKQRIFGVIPNFYTSYVWNAAPLTAGQKFKLAWRSAIDPFAFISSAGIAGVEQAQNDFSGYGQGAAGYAKRFAASWGDGLIGTMIGGAALPALFHQDPRYYYKGSGTIRQRALYAIATTVICKGDNGRWQPNYANVLGNLAAGGLSNLYYPKDERNGASTTIDNALIGTAAGAAGALIQEFLLKKITPGSAAHNKP